MLSDSDNEKDGYDKENNRWTEYDPLVKKKQINNKLARDTNMIIPSKSS